MIENERIQLRISSELLDFCGQNFDNVSQFIREAIREKINSTENTDPSSLIEIRTRTPYTFFGSFVRVIDGDSLVVKLELGFFINYNTKIRLAGIDVPSIDTENAASCEELNPQRYSKIPA